MPVVFGQDFGDSPDPSTLVKVAIDVKRRKLYVHECFYSSQLDADKIFSLDKEYAGNNLIIADYSESILIRTFKKWKLNIKKCIKGQGSVLAGIRMMQGFEIVVSPSSTNIMKELNNYKWNDKKSGVPVDAYNHIIDPIRYVLQWATQRPKGVKVKKHG